MHKNTPKINGKPPKFQPPKFFWLRPCFNIYQR